MNNTRRKEIEKLADLADELKGKIEDVLSEEQDYRDNMPENLAQSEKAEASDNAIQYLESALSEIESVVENLRSAGE